MQVSPEPRGSPFIPSPSYNDNRREAQCEWQEAGYGEVSPIEAGRVAGDGRLSGTWLRHRASCRGAEHQCHQKINNKLELYSVENALSKRKQLEADRVFGTEVAGGRSSEVWLQVRIPPALHPVLRIIIRPVHGLGRHNPVCTEPHVTHPSNRLHPLYSTPLCC